MEDLKQGAANFDGYGSVFIPVPTNRLNRYLSVPIIFAKTATGTDRPGTDYFAKMATGTDYPGIEFNTGPFPWRSTIHKHSKCQSVWEKKVQAHPLHVGVEARDRIQDVRSVFVRADL